MKLTQNLVIGMNTIASLRGSQGSVVNSEQLATKLGVSVYFLQQVLRRLHRAKLINRRRGPGGGYWVDNARVPANVVAEAVGTTFVTAPGVEFGAVAELDKAIYHAFLKTVV